jgi:Costars
MEDTVANEIRHLVAAIKRLGTQNSLGQYTVKYGKLFDDDEVSNTFEALLGTLRAAKKRNIVTFEGEILLQGVHNDVEVVLLE